MSKKTIYYDVTDTIQFIRDHERASGIQRFVIRIARDIVANQGTGAIRLIFWNDSEAKAYWTSADIFGDDVELDDESFARYFGSSSSLVGQYVRAHYAGVQRYWQRLRLPVSNALNGGRSYSKRNIRSSPLPPGAENAEVIELGEDDHVVMPGASWASPGYLDFVERARARGAHVSQVIYDLTPIIYPEFARGVARAEFKRWLDRTCRISDRFIAISKATKSDLATYISQNDLPRVPIHVVPLAHEFVVKEQHAGDVAHLRGEIRSAAAHPYVLCVGVSEGRKNVHQLVLAFEALRLRFGADTPRLVLAGIKAGMSPDFARHMKRTRWLEGLVQLVERPSDAELSYLYRNCLFSVYPSLYEGWGLPIGEALWHGRAVAASGTSSMPEVGGDLVLYFDPRSLSEMIRVVGSLMEDDELRETLAARANAARAAGKLRSWSGVATEFWTAITEADAKTEDEESISG